MKQILYPRISFAVACLISVTSACASSHDGAAATATTDAPRSHRHHHHHGETASTSTASRPPRHRSSSSHAAGSSSSEPANSLPTLSLSPLPGGTQSATTLPPHSSVAGGLPADLQALLSTSRTHSRATTPTRTPPESQRKPSSHTPAFQPRHSIFHAGFQKWTHKGPQDKTQAYHAGLRGHTHSYDDAPQHLIQAAQKGALPEEQHPAALYHLGYALHTAQRHDFQLTGADIHVVEHLVHLSIGLQTLLADTAVATDVAQALERIGTHNVFLKTFIDTLKTIHQKAREKKLEK